MTIEKDVASLLCCIYFGGLITAVVCSLVGIAVSERSPGSGLLSEMFFDFFLQRLEVLVIQIFHLPG